MDFSQINSLAGEGSSAAKAVASSLSSPRALKATPKDAPASTGGTANSSSSNSSDITSNDFLTLLVSELKNQDPTQPTDPNQYITQLAQVNSLQQLISINQGIGTLDGAVSGTGSPSSSSTGSNSKANVVASVADANIAPNLHPISSQNAIWGGSTPS